MRHRSPDEIQVGGRSLSEILDDHDTWLQSGCEKGVRAKLAGADLSSVHLADRDLRQADLTEADLRGADLSRLRLNGAVLRDTDFRHATLSNADLSDDADPITIRNSPLIGPIPTDTEGMAVGGADLTIAAVPESFPLVRMVARCERITGGVRRVAVLMSVLLAVGLYWVLTTTDAELLLDTEVFRVPFTQVPVTTTMIYWLAPPEILLAFFWWHLLYLDRLWRWGAGLPALFPDGSSLASRSALWPLNVFAARWMPQLKEETLTPRWAPVPRWLVEGALFWATPLVLAAFWWRYLTLQETAGAALIIVTLASAAGLAHSRSRVVRRVLQVDGLHTGSDRAFRRRAFARAALLTASAFAAFSYVAVESPLASVVPTRMEVYFAALSRKPAVGAAADIQGVSGAKLRGRSLLFAVLSYCFLARADLRGARLEGASLAVSDLRGADLRDADLRGGSLFSARLAGARLKGTDLRGANLRCATGLNDAQLGAAVTDAASVLPDGSPGPFQPGSGATTVNIAECANWQPEAGVPVPRQRDRARRPSLSPPAEPDLGPIPELKPRTTKAVPEAGAGESRP